MTHYEGNSPQSVYAKNLRQEFGYPLRCPEPKPGLPQSYQESGLHIGDVGYVDRLGIFQVQFNICSTPDHDLHQCNRASLVDLVDLVKITSNDITSIPRAFSPGREICHGVASPVDDGLGNIRRFHACSTSGAILVLPSGATSEYLNEKREKDFRILAERHGERWCEYVDRNSIYLITGFYKSARWHLASFKGLPYSAKGQANFLYDKSAIGRCRWHSNCDPRDSGENAKENQAVFVSGFKIELRNTVQVENFPQRQTVNTWGDLIKDIKEFITGVGMNITHIPGSSSPESDRNPNARVAITHDKEWIRMLKENELSYEEMANEECFLAFLEENYTVDPNSNNLVSQRKANPVPFDMPHEIARSECMGECNDVQDAVIRDPVELSPDYHTDKAAHLNSLGRARNCFECSGELSHPDDVVHQAHRCRKWKRTANSIQERELCGDENRLQDMHPSPTSSVIQIDEPVEEVVITNIRVTDAALSLRRIPAGFIVVFDHNGLEWRTENKRVSVDNDIINWDEQILMPTDPSATVRFRIYASFELQPTMGYGEQLRNLTITVRQLLEYNEKSLAFTLFPKDGDRTSPCSSLLVAINRGTHTYGETLPSRVVDPRPHSSTIESQDELLKATNNAHAAFSRYRKHGEQRDIERSIEQFERALRLCPPDHPCHAAAQSNLATSKLFFCQAHDTGISFDVPMSLYQDALDARPAGHLDRPYTLIQLAMVHLARFKKERQEFDGAQAEEFLHEAVDLSPLQSHERRAGVFMLQLHTKHATYVRMDDGLPLRLGATDMDPFELGVHLLRRFERFGYIKDIEQAPVSLERSVQSSSLWEERYLASSSNLGVAFFHRYRHLGVLRDLENAITRFRNAMGLSPDYHRNKLALLNNLSGALLARFDHLGEVSDLQDAIARLRDAVELTPNQHPDKPGRLSNLGTALQSRFKCLGELGDLEDGITNLRNAVELSTREIPVTSRMGL